MNFEEIEHYITEISKHEFADRDLELQKTITKIKQEMNAKGLLNSTITLQKFAEFLAEELQIRLEHVKDLLINSINKLDYKKSDDIITKVKILYQDLAFSEKKKITEFYKKHGNNIFDSLLNKNMLQQITDMTNSVVERSIRKNNLIIHFEYASVINKPSKTSIIFIKPSFAGFGIDVMALYEKHFKN